MTDEQTTQATPNSEENPLEKFLYHQRRAAEAGAKALAGWIPPEVREHTKEAGKEFLMSFKVLVEGAASVMEREANRMRNAAEGHDSGRAGDGPSTTGKTKVKVEVS
ncbi:MAG: hypothetical protein KF716_03415 [Anaerolineae bacterium]|nr:hypothetical protein [Anaerolineae bacterium]